jgi:hypothetical protein
MNHDEKLKFFLTLKPTIVTYDYLKIVKESKRDGYVITKESANRVAYFGKKYKREDGTEPDPSEEMRVYNRLGRHVKQTISTGKILIEMGTIKNRKRHTAITYYIADCNGKRELTKEELQAYLTPKQYENEVKEVESRMYYVVNMDDIQKINGVTL